jgi:energy-coupling factor transporter ATP-binding protein EcfA2
MEEERAVHFRRMTIDNPRPFTWPVEFEFNERANLFIGPNATGKSTVLRELNKMRAEVSDDWLGYDFSPDQDGTEWRPDQSDIPIVYLPSIRVGSNSPRLGQNAQQFLEMTEDKDPATNFDGSLALSRPFYDYPIFYAERVHHVTEDLRQQVGHIALNSTTDFFDRAGLVREFVHKYQNLRRIRTSSSDPFRNAVQHILSGISDYIEASPGLSSRGRIQVSDLSGMRGFDARDIYMALDAYWKDSSEYSVTRVPGPNFDNRHIQSIEHNVLNIDNEDAFMHSMEGFSSKAAANLHKAIMMGHYCAAEICSEVLYQTEPKHYFFSSGNRDVSGFPIETADYFSVFRTSDILEVSDSGEGIRSRDLSAGTEGTVWWIRFLALNMARHYDYEFGWEKKPAILLIDEIENHLHPTWQRRVIPALLEHFHGLQIFATTHSPFVVAGLRAGQVHLLRRDEYGVVTASTNSEDIVGWTADEILRVMMGVQDPTDDETARNAAELRQLRNEGPGDTAEEEEQRQARMQELRHMVDRDLLAGGPAAAQRELFESQFAEALEKYQRSRDLGQENG